MRNDRLQLFDIILHGMSKILKSKCIPFYHLMFIVRYVGKGKQESICNFSFSGSMYLNQQHCADQEPCFFSLVIEK